MLRNRSRNALHTNANLQQNALLPCGGRLIRGRVVTWVIAVGLLCTFLALLGISRQLSSAADESETQQAEQALKISVPSKAFCTRALQARPPFVCAHGGDTSLHPPNTAAAYAAALVHTDCVEIDVSLTLDYQLVSMHDRDLEQLLQTKGAKVGQYSLHELQSHDWPQGNRVLTVQQALAAALPRAAQLILDVKAEATEQMLRLSNGSFVSQHSYLAEQLLQLMSAHEQCSSSCLEWSKADEAIKQVMQRAPGQLAGYVVMREKAASTNKDDSQWQYSDPLRAGLQEAQVAAVHHELLDSQLLSTLHSNGKLAYAWTADTPAELQRLLDLGLNGIVTNRPALLSQAVNERLSKCSTVQQRG